MTIHATWQTCNPRAYNNHMTDASPREMTRLTVNLAPRSLAALIDRADREGATRTDIVNRALQFYAEMMREQDHGKTIALIGVDGETAERVKVI